MHLTSFWCLLTKSTTLEILLALKHKKEITKIKNQTCVPDEIQQEDKPTSNDPLKIPSGPITRARSKSIKEALNGLVQEVWVKQMTICSTIDYKDVENVTSVIWVEHGDVDRIMGLKTSN